MGSVRMCRLRDRLVAAVFALTVPSIALADVCQPVLDEAGLEQSILCQISVDPSEPGPIIVDLAPLSTTDLGKSTRPLLAATQATFPATGQSRALIAAPTSGTFFGLALQNQEQVESIVSVELWDAGSVVASSSLALPPLTRLS